MLPLVRTLSLLARAAILGALVALLAAAPAWAAPLSGPKAAATAHERPNVIAVYDGVQLLEPSDEALAIGFHEAGGNHPALVPVGRILRNENPATTGRTASRPFPDVRVLPGRGRGGPATGAVDVALPPGTDVRAPVTGTIAAVSPYALYGGTITDILVEIEPEGRPDVRVVMYHLEDVQVAVGDAVTAGDTVIAGGARTLAVQNQIDRYATSCPCPHVDMRMRVATPE
ncbi:MAG: M23 family metallopeptidase [Actinobacteria bacterium]|nr:M23 family metallopeptidase [Actinomycetota bacterium]